MNANRFWGQQLKKNAAGAPKWRVETEPDTPENATMLAWMEKWQHDFTYFNNTGCGCCINFYEFDAPDEAIAELPPDWLQAMETPKKR